MGIGFKISDTPHVQDTLRVHKTHHVYYDAKNEIFCENFMKDINFLMHSYKDVRKHVATCSEDIYE